ncbi:DUF1819 family protein [Photobacterium carnosum]|uniref:DUF1819 domain-containing protein n=1 Tax=Photobacterium carnosum TaxID=2023717 RepID=A0A2N4UM75_9GAMM|nr:DUF1819 family protein [Photobacterium carnosum]PLC56106.1 hypothetical protein CIK00_20195 [Photobacterium carnosum]
MNPAKQYLGDIIGGGIMLRESRLIAELLLSEPDVETWSQKIKNENMLQKTSVHSAKRFASTIKKRLEPMGKEFLADFIEADDIYATQLLLIAIMLNSPVVADFMKTELADAHRLCREKLDSHCWMEFYEQRSRVIPELTEYSESSIKKMGNNVIKVLADTQYLESGRSKILQTVFVQPETLAWVKKLEKPELIEALQIGR